MLDGWYGLMFVTDGWSRELGINVASLSFSLSDFPSALLISACACLFFSWLSPGDPRILEMWKGNLLLLGFTGVDVQCVEGSGDEIHGTGKGDEVYGADKGDEIYGTERGDEIHGTDRGDDIQGADKDDEIHGNDCGDEINGTDKGDEILGAMQGADSGPI